MKDYIEEYCHHVFAHSMLDDINDTGYDINLVSLQYI
jgi:hypothetical protein